MNDDPDEDIDEVDEPQIANDFPDSEPATQPAKTKDSPLSKEGEELLLFWKQVFAHPVGRRAMWKILQEAHTFNPQYGVGPTGFPQPEASWFHAGEQAIGLRMYHAWLAMEPQGVTAMLFEHHPLFPKPSPPSKPKRKRGQS